MVAEPLHLVVVEQMGVVRRYKARRNSRREMRRQMKELKALMHGLVHASG